MTSISLISVIEVLRKAKLPMCAKHIARVGSLDAKQVSIDLANLRSELIVYTICNTQYFELASHAKE